MSNSPKQPRSEYQSPTPLTKERGLQPAKNPPPMPQVKPTKSESNSKNN